MARRLLDGPAVAAALRVQPQTVRLWASRGLLTRYGRDSRGRVLFDLYEAIGVSQRSVAAGQAVPSTPGRSRTAMSSTTVSRAGGPS